jgi:hypothetical protein
VPVAGERGDLGVRRKARSRSCLRRTWRSHDEQRQDDP